MKIRVWSAMFIAGVITASITSSFALTTRAAAAANNQTYCENRADDVTDSIKQNLTDLESNDPMLVRWDWIGKESMMYRPYAAKCPPEPAKRRDPRLQHDRTCGRPLARRQTVAGRNEPRTTDARPLPEGRLSNRARRALRKRRTAREPTFRLLEHAQSRRRITRPLCQRRLLTESARFYRAP